MFFERPVGVHKYIVQISRAEYVEVFAECVVDNRLESRRCVGQPKWHDTVFVKSESCLECCLLFFPCRHANPVISLADIELSKPLCSLELILEV